MTEINDGIFYRTADGRDMKIKFEEVSPASRSAEETAIYVTLAAAALTGIVSRGPIEANRAAKLADEFAIALMERIKK